MPARASHLLVLQDDALPVTGFAQKLAASLTERPADVLCLFTPGFNKLRVEVAKAHAAQLSYLPLQVGAFVPCVAISYPRRFVGELLDWVDHRSSDRQQNQLRGADDGVLALYCRVKRIRPLLLVPSIVEHDHLIPSIGKEHRRAGPHRRAALLQSP